MRYLVLLGLICVSGCANMTTKDYVLTGAGVLAVGYAVAHQNSNNSDLRVAKPTVNCNGGACQ